MTTHQQGKRQVLARYRPGGSWWFLFILFAGMTVLGTQMGAGNLTIFFVLPSFCLLAFFIHFVYIINADSAGLTIWNWRGRARIPWEDVQDYYLHMPYRRSSSGTIETISRSVRITPADYGYEPLKKCITEHTPHLSVRDWATLGCRPNDPATIVFRYSWISEAVLGIVSAILTVVVACAIFPKAVSTGYLLAEYSGIGWAVGFVLLTLLMPVLIGFMTWVCYAGFSDLWKRRNHCLTVTNEGITFEDGIATVSASWPEVTEWHIDTVKRGRFVVFRYVIVTPRGDIEFTHRLGVEGTGKSCRLLRMILERHVGPITQEAAGETIAWQSDRRWKYLQNDSSTAVHIYRTYINRALLFFVWAYPAVPIFSLALERAANLNPIHDPPVLCLAAMVAIALYFQWRYRTGALITDSTGIRSYSVFGEKRIAWMNVVSYTKGDCTAIVRGEGKTLIFWLTISDAKKLMDTIQEKAINSKNREWGNREA